MDDPRLISTEPPPPEPSVGSPRIKFLGPILFEAGQRRELRFEITEADTPFNVIGFAVPSDPRMNVFMLQDARRNGASIMQTPNAIPAIVFSEEAAGTQLGIDTLRYGDSLTLVVENASQAPALFVAVLFGVSEPNIPAGLPTPDMLLTTYGPARIMASSTAVFEVEAKIDGEPAMLLVHGGSAEHMNIVQLDVAGKRQLEAPVAASRFDGAQRQRDANLGREPAMAFKDAAFKRGDKIRLVVQNSSNEAREFGAVLLGKKL
jgi:hypothetical protein